MGKIYACYGAIGMDIHGLIIKKCMINDDTYINVTNVTINVTNVTSITTLEGNPPFETYRN